VLVLNGFHAKANGFLLYLNEAMYTVLAESIGRSCLLSCRVGGGDVFGAGGCRAFCCFVLFVARSVGI